MRRIATMSALGILVASALALYAIKYDTGRLGAEVAELSDKITGNEAEIAVLRAEKANLTSPSRIDRLTKAHLALRPTAPKQLGSIADLPWRGDTQTSTKDAPPVVLQP